jgi:hypothetical protein
MKTLRPCSQGVSSDLFSVLIPSKSKLFNPSLVLPRPTGARAAFTTTRATRLAPKRAFPLGPGTEGMRRLFSFSRPSGTAAMRKYRPFIYDWPNASNRPEGDLRRWPYERAVSARKRSLAEGVGCAITGHWPAVRPLGIGARFTDCGAQMIIVSG